jgi:ubiquinone/menaquinone biosynthesis C-methylase UbiE
MEMDKLHLPDESFDVVVGNYSLCCCMNYEAALAEILRVLKPGGRLLYNHNGPNDSLEFQLTRKLLEKYQSKRPSARLKLIREANSMQDRAWSRYRDPFVALALMRSLGYENTDASITQRIVQYGTVQAYVDRLLSMDWLHEAKEMKSMALRELKQEAIKVLGPFSSKYGFSVGDDMVFFSGFRWSSRFRHV